MVATLTRFFESFTTRTVPAFSLSNLPDFPYSEFNSRQTYYTECEEWYNGTVLEEQLTAANGKSVDRYPVKINPIKRAVTKHVATLFGEVAQDDRPLVYPRVVPREDSQKEASTKAESVLYQTWFESNGRALQLENGAISQIYGGCIFRAAYDPLDLLRSVPIRIEKIHPRWFVGRPSAKDMFRLREAWICQPIMPDEAAEFGVALPSEDYGWMIEHWTLSNYEATINGEPITIALGGDRMTIGGNPFGFVPIVYIPHFRSTGFYGENLFDHVKGVVKELNLRVADYGDAVNTDSHAYLGMRNVQGAPSVEQPAPGLNVINLHSNPNLTGQENNPDMFPLGKPNASTVMNDLIEALEASFRRDAFVPSISDGEDEGSQRSGLTLAMRMWPLVSHTGLERIWWADGLNLLNRMILKMLQIKGEAGITEEQASMSIKQVWSPALPRDREADVNEAVQRVGGWVASPEHMLEKLGDSEDPHKEYQEILSFQKKKAETTAAAQPAFGGGGFGNKPGQNGGGQPVKSDTQTGKMQTTE